jgi:hypothetical protein
VVENLRGLAPNSLFVFGRRDPFVPSARTNGLLSALEMHAPRAHVAKIHGGHFKTLVASGRYQRTLAGVASARTKWQVGLREPVVGAVTALQLTRVTVKREGYSLRDSFSASMMSESTLAGSVASGSGPVKYVSPTRKQ